MKYYDGYINLQGRKNFAEWLKGVLSEGIDVAHYAEVACNTTSFESPDETNGIEVPTHQTRDNNPHVYNFAGPEIDWVEHDDAIGDE